jgi:hypothetical protein
VIGTHAIGAHHLCRMLVPQMRERERVGPCRLYYTRNTIGT